MKGRWGKSVGKLWFKIYPPVFQCNQSPIKRDLTGAMNHINWVLCWWWKKGLSSFLHMKKLWNYGHLDKVKGDTFHCHSYSQVFLGDHFFSAFLATVATISMQSRGQGWWMVSGMKPDIQDYRNLFRSATIASSLGNHLVIQYSLLFRTSCLHLPLHIPQYYSNMSSNERQAVIYI